jgi:PAS domain S-box-containing protein
MGQAVSSSARPTAGFYDTSSDDPFCRLIIEASPDFIYIYDRIEGRYLFASERCKAMLGYTPQQFVQFTRKDIEQLIHPEDLARAKAHYGRQELLDDTEISNTTYRFRHAGGDHRLMRCRQKVFSRDQKREVRCILGVGTDITDEANRRAEMDSLRSQILSIRDDEQKRIGQQMHDTAMQDIVGAALLLRRLEGTPHKGLSVIGEAGALLSRALTQMIDMTNGLATAKGSSRSAPRAEVAEETAR